MVLKIAQNLSFFPLVLLFWGVFPLVSLLPRISWCQCLSRLPSIWLEDQTSAKLPTLFYFSHFFRRLKTEHCLGQMENIGRLVQKILHHRYIVKHTSKQVFWQLFSFYLESFENVKVLQRIRHYFTCKLSQKVIYLSAKLSLE